MYYGAWRDSALLRMPPYDPTQIQAQLGVPHSEIQVELDWQPNWYDVWELDGGTPHMHIPIWDLWLYAQTMVGTPHNILRYIQSKNMGNILTNLPVYMVMHCAHEMFMSMLMKLSCAPPLYRIMQPATIWCSKCIVKGLRDLVYWTTGLVITLCYFCPFWTHPLVYCVRIWLN